MNPSSVEASPAKLEDMLQRSLDVLERSQAALERSLAMESTLSRLAEGQEELRRMIMVMVNGSDVPIMIPAAFVKREEGDEIDNIELSSTTPASPLRVTEAVENAEEEDDISSVSSVSTDEDVDYMDISSAHILEGEKNNAAGRPACGDLPVPHSVTGSLSSGQEGAEESDEEDNGASSMSSEHEASTSGEETDLDGEDTGREGSGDASAPNGYNSELLALWKCAVCGKLIKGAWHCRQHHIESHEELKLPCPVTGCSARRSSQNFVSHLRVAHKTAKSSLPVEQRAQLQRQQDDNKQKAMECEMKYFPPSSLVSFAETTGRKAVSCKKCGKIYVDLTARRNHVGAHINLKMHCPIRGCKHSGVAGTIKRHVSRVHEKTLAKLTVDERHRFDEARRKFNEDVEAAMGEYFPEQTEEKSPFCKKCGKRASTLQRTRDHVATHLKAKFPCPFRRCAYSGRVRTMFSHLRKYHGKNLEKLTKVQRGRFEESRRQFREQVDAVMEEYFPFN